MFEFNINLVHQEGFEPPTFRFVAEHSIQLSYWCIHYIIIAFGIIFKMFLKILQKNLQKLLQIFKICAIIYKRWAKNNISRCSAVGSARGLGPWGRRFDPCHLDHILAVNYIYCLFFIKIWVFNSFYSVSIISHNISIDVNNVVNKLHLY